ncbi:MAG: hemin uptake protein HemP [Roseibium sp.]|nr:hemin uptake protein HemP [Roseibium sp.]
MRTKIRQSRLTLAPCSKTDAPAAPAASSAGSAPIPSKTLFQGQRQLHIEHNEQIYRLSITKFGKLILTK